MYQTNTNIQAITAAKNLRVELDLTTKIYTVIEFADNQLWKDNFSNIESAMEFFNKRNSIRKNGTKWNDRIHTI
tara:strand:+ start:2279 stop:2500 length:222 start_codon:yes stop_codon:yes gene_type:complete